MYRHSEVTPKEVATQTNGNGLESDIENICLLLLATHESVGNHLSEIETAKENLKNAVRDYNENRFLLLVKRLLENGLGWCLECKRPHVLHELKLLGRQTYRGTATYNPEFDGFKEIYFRIHTVCPKCFEAAFDDNGVTRIEVSETGVYMRQGKDLKPLPEKTSVRSMPYFDEQRLIDEQKVFQEMLVRMEIPPTISYEFGGTNFPNIRIEKNLYPCDYFEPDKSKLVLTKTDSR